MNTNTMLNSHHKAILQILSQSDTLSVYDIALRTGMSRVSTQRYIIELVELGYIERDNSNGRITIYKRSNKTLQPSKEIPSTNIEKKIFISHSTKDKVFVEHLFTLLKNVGVSENNIFCSSIAQCGIGNGMNIYDCLKQTISKEAVYMLYVCSPRYYESATSLNETGAGWVLNIPFCCILMKDIDVQNMRGVYNSSTIAITINGDDAEQRIISLLQNIAQQLQLQLVDERFWSQHIRTFIKSGRRCGPTKK